MVNSSWNHHPGINCAQTAPCLLQHIIQDTVKLHISGGHDLTGIFDKLLHAVYIVLYLPHMLLTRKKLQLIHMVLHVMLQGSYLILVLKDNIDLIGINPDLLPQHLVFIFLRKAFEQQIVETHH